MTPARPRSETSTRRFARGGWAGRSVIARRTRKHLACDRAPQSYARPQPARHYSLCSSFSGSSLPSAPKGLPCCSLCSQTYVNIAFFFLIFRYAQSLHFASKMTILHIKMSFCLHLLRILFYITFVPLSCLSHVEQNIYNNNY